MERRLRSLLTITALAGALGANAAPPSPLFTYSGFLLDGAGQPVTAQVPITFNFYTTPTGGSAIYTDVVSVRPANDGWFTAQIGSSGSPIDHTQFAQALWVGITISGDMEMLPRVKLTSVPYALNADWDALSSKPSTFPPSAHTHAGSDVTSAVANVPWSGVTSKPTNIATSVTAPLSFNTPSNVIISQAGAATSGYLTNTDWNTFNGKAPATGSPNYAPASGSANYAPASGSANYAPASGSANYIQSQTAVIQAAGFNINGLASFASGDVTINNVGRILGSNVAGNLHLDSDAAGTDGRIYLDYYSGRGTRFGTGASNYAAEIDNAGTFNTNGSVIANGVVRGADTGIGVALQIGNDAELVDVNLGNTARLRGQGNADAGVLELGNARNTVISSNGDSWINGELAVGFTTPPAGSSFGLTVAPSVGTNHVARFGAGDNPLYVISPDAALGFNLYGNGGPNWVYGESSTAQYAGFVAMNRTAPGAIITGMTATTGTSGAAATVQHTLAVWGNDTVTIGDGAVTDATKLINTSAGTGPSAFLSRTGTWTNASSRAYKRDIAPWSRGLETLDKVHVYSYRFRADHADDGREHVGVIAEELPDIVASQDRTGAPTAELIGLSLAAGRELHAKVKALEAENQALKTRLERLEALVGDPRPRGRR